MGSNALKISESPEVRQHYWSILRAFSVLMCSVSLWGVVSCRAGHELTVGGVLNAVSHRGKGCCGLRRVTKGFQQQSGLGGF